MAAELFETTKQCGRCKRHLPTEKFGVHGRSKDGLQSYCRECALAYARERNEQKIAQYTFRTEVLTNATADELIAELRSRGYTGELELVKRETFKL